MRISILKILSLSSYSTIMIIGHHIGGPWILYVLQGVSSSDPSTVLMSLSLVIVLLYFVYSIPKPNRKYDPALWLVGGLILLEPVVSSAWENRSHIVHHTVSILTSIGFICIWLTAIFYLFNSKLSIEK